MKTGIRFVIFSALFAGVVIGGCRGNAEEQKKTETAAIEVVQGVVEAIEMPRTLPLTGSLIANQQSDVAANASGQVIQTFVERGSSVKKGQPLVQLDIRSAEFSSAEAHANLESAEAHLQLANTVCQRNEKLFKKGAISREEWERTDNQCKASASSEKAAQARAGLAGKFLTDMTVRAPFEGMIGERYVSVGEYVQPPSKVALVIQISPLKLQLSVPEEEISLITIGEDVSFQVQAYPGENFTGRTAFIAPHVRQATRDLLVEAVVPNKDQRLRPGMFATAEIRLAGQILPVVPVTALRYQNGNSRIFMITGGRVEERIVQTGSVREGLISVIHGIKPGERFVKQLDDQIREGVLVR